MSFAVRHVEIEGYRSVRRIGFPTGRLSAFVGANSVGKTDHYRALQLFQAAADRSLGRELAADGGLASVLWARAARAARCACDSG